MPRGASLGWRGRPEVDLACVVAAGFASARAMTSIRSPLPERTFQVTATNGTPLPRPSVSRTSNRATRNGLANTSWFSPSEITSAAPASVASVVKVTGDPSRPDTFAATVMGVNDMGMNDTQAKPSALVLVDALGRGLPRSSSAGPQSSHMLWRTPSPVVALHDTGTFPTPSPLTSVTRTINGRPSACPTLPSWLAPKTVVIAAGVAGWTGSLMPSSPQANRARASGGKNQGVLRVRIFASSERAAFTRSGAGSPAPRLRHW